MLISELMSLDVLTASLRRPVFQLATMMKQNHYSCLVIAEDGKPVGIVTERDMVRVLEESTHNPGIHLRPAAEVMSCPPLTIVSDADLLDALVITRSHRIRHLPVVDADGDLVGIVTQTNLITAYMSEVERQRAALEAEVAERTQSVLQANEQLKLMALEDSLLRIGNRRSMETDLAHTEALARRYGSLYSLALFDVDHFKDYNDCLGHLAGDQALRDIAEFLRNGIRGADRLYRYGGEELLLLLPETGGEDAVLLVDRLLRGVRELGIKHPLSRPGMLTLSCGISEVQGYNSEAQQGWQEAVRRADAALYEAKRAGRDRAVLAPAAGKGAARSPRRAPAHERRAASPASDSSQVRLSA